MAPIYLFVVAYSSPGGALNLDLHRRDLSHASKGLWDGFLCGDDLAYELCCFKDCSDCHSQHRLENLDGMSLVLHFPLFGLVLRQISDCLMRIQDLRDDQYRGNDTLMVLT